MPNIKYHDMREYDGVQGREDRIARPSISYPTALTIRVDSGSEFSVPGHGAIVLPDDFDYLVTDIPNECQCMAYLVQDTSDDSYEILVDEFDMSAPAQPYQFKDGAYKMLTRVWYAKIPPNTNVNLDAVDLTIHRTILVNDEE